MYMYMYMQVVKTLLKHGSDPRQTNDKGLSPADACKDPAILKILKGNEAIEAEKDIEKEAEKEGEQGGNGHVEGGDSETVKGGDVGEEEEEGDEDVFESKIETIRDTSTTAKRGKGKSRQRERGSRSSEEGPIPSKMASARKQLKDDFTSDVAAPEEPKVSSTMVENPAGLASSGGGASLTKLIGKATPFFSDISSSESESELPDVKMTSVEKKEDSPVLSEMEDKEKGGGGEDKQIGSPEEVREERSEEVGSPLLMKEEGKVKISHEDQQLAAGECVSEDCLIHYYAKSTKGVCVCISCFVT